MIITAVKIKGRENKRREIIQTLSCITDQVKQCKGCTGASCYQDINDQDTFYHVQEWMSQQDLDDHLNSKLFSALLGIQSILQETPQVEFMSRKDELPGENR